LVFITLNLGGKELDVTEAISKRRAYRSLKSVEITEELVDDLVQHAHLSATCFNNQPARFMFVYEPKILERLKGTLNKGNAWAKSASMIIAVFSKLALDCDVHGRIYYLFDTGQETAFLQLRATELGLVAHPIAGFHEDEVKELLGIPTETTVITLIIVGKKSDSINPLLSEKQIESEKTRPERLSIEKISFKNKYISTED
jgi:nitroreductase